MDGVLQIVALAQRFPLPREVAEDAVSSVLAPCIPWAGLWMVPAALLLIFLERRKDAGPHDAGGKKRMLSLFFAGAGLRLVLGVWAPHHINGQGPHWIASAFWNPALIERYGPGYSEVLGTFARLLDRSPDFTIFVVNVLLSSLLPLLAYALVRNMGMDRNRSLIAGTILALDPIMVRFAASEGYFPLITVLTLAAALSLMRAARLAADNRTLRALLPAVAAGLLASQAARTHPVAWIPLAVAILAPAASAPRFDKERNRWLFALAGACVVAAVLFVTSGGWVFKTLGTILTPPVDSGHFGVDRAASVPWGWLLLLQLVLAPLSRLARPKLPFVIGAAGLLAMVATRDNFWQSQLWRASYDRLFLPLVIVGLAALLPSDWKQPGGIVKGKRLKRVLPWCIAAVLPLLFLGLYAPDIFRQNTEQMEYRFLRERLNEIPGECRVAIPLAPNRRPLRIPDYISSDGRHSPDRTPNVTSLEELDELAASGRCVYYIRISSCAREVNRSTCDKLETSPLLTETARATFPARPSFPAEPYDTDTVNVVMYRLER